MPPKKRQRLKKAFTTIGLWLPTFLGLPPFASLSSFAFLSLSQSAALEMADNAFLVVVVGFIIIVVIIDVVIVVGVVVFNVIFDVFGDFYLKFLFRSLQIIDWNSERSWAVLVDID